MAPEQAAGARGQVGPRSDVYSLGVILYHMLTGRPPFQAASPVDTVLMVLEQDPVPPRMLNPKADRDLEMICLRCLQKPTDLRYAIRRRPGRRSRSVSERRTHLRPQRPLRAGAGVVAPRDASRRRAGKLGPAVDVAQPGAARRLLR